MNFTSLNHKKHIFLDKLQGLLYHIIKIEAFDKLRINYLVKIKLIYQLLACYIYSPEKGYYRVSTIV